MYYSRHKFRTSVKSWISNEKVYRFISFNKKAWRKPYTDIHKSQESMQNMVLKKISSS